MNETPTTEQQIPATGAAPFSPASEMREAYWRMKERRIRVSVARSTRAGSIGHPCERFIFYERTVPASQRVPHGVHKSCGGEGLVASGWLVEFCPVFGQIAPT